MKKYTVIYAEYFQSGSHRNAITKMVHIECEPENLKSEIEKTCDISAVWFVFDGHCQLTKD